MKVLKTIFIILIIIVAIPLVAAVFVKKSYDVERETIINAPIDEVFDYVKYLKNQDNFSKWASLDPNMKKEYRGTDGTVGFVSAWSSERGDVGSGEQEITNIVEGQRIDYELRFLEPWESRMPAYMITEKVNENQTKVRWGVNGKVKYPMNLMMAFMNVDKAIGGDFEAGLNNLKAILEE